MDVKQLSMIDSSGIEDIDDIKKNCKRSGYNFEDFKFEIANKTVSNDQCYIPQGEITVTHKISKIFKLYKIGNDTAWTGNFIEDIRKKCF